VKDLIRASIIRGIATGVGTGVLAGAISGSSLLQIFVGPAMLFSFLEWRKYANIG
jgi:hypothetical protein